MQTEFNERFYRNFDSNERFEIFSVSYKETDLWIAIDKKSYSDKINNYIFARIIHYRSEIDNFVQNHNDFITSLKPVCIKDSMPQIVSEMIEASNKANIGPMSAVAGAFSQFIANDIIKEFNVNEIIIENGGDIFLKLSKSVTLSVFAGNSVLSGKIGVKINPEDTPVGVCTSAGTVGPSLSFGKADAVMIICKNTLLADSYATAFANFIKTKDCIKSQIEITKTVDEILSAIIIKDDIVGISGRFDVNFLKNLK